MSAISTPSVKICGLTRAQDVDAAIDNGATFLGFIVEAPSKRRVNVMDAATLCRAVKDRAKTVAVVVNADDDLLSKIMAHMKPDVVQCHGDESPARIAQIAAQHKVGVIKAVPVASDADMKAAEQFSGVADFILFDAKPPKGEAVRGGHGQSIDWAIIERAPMPKIFALAGGLNAANVGEALARTKAPILDVSSGVESAPGVKDMTKIKAFMSAVKKADHHG